MEHVRRLLRFFTRESRQYGMLGAGPVIAYTTAKAGLMHLTCSLAKDLALYGRVNAVAPGNIDTDMTRAAGEGCIASVVQAPP
jgi:NAD(P)-dependent dehydrogenase (short-subunit alcohol dehydrogenase family)